MYIMYISTYYREKTEINIVILIENDIQGEIAMTLEERGNLINIDTFLSELLDAGSEQEADQVRKKYDEFMHSADTPVIGSILKNGTLLAKRGIAGEKISSQSYRIQTLSDAEKSELEEVMHIIDENRFNYHFQPIVSAVNGDIYSYEALMRPVSEMKITPYHIIKYSEITDRMNDIERATFMNILRLIDTDKISPEGDRQLFINSIPRARLDIADQRVVMSLMLKHADHVVVEMTEESEIDETNLNTLRERYRNMGIQLALDDYGTGYSNVSNLLRYAPEIVKIDRSLISGIQNDPKKRHFFREIVDFCHSNNIKALAEGVETSEELRTVIMMGADLIQGYYTARPAAELLKALPDDLISEIQRYCQEREDGSSQQIYHADSYEMIVLERLAECNINRLILGKNGDGEVTVSSNPTMDMPILISTVKGYTGTLILKNVWLTSNKSRPCISLAENSHLTIVLSGENTLDKGGILVPEDAELTVSGDGKLNISVDSKEYYGIGNDPYSKHGTINFDQSGCISITAHGQKGVGIGSGTGGKINIIQGQYVIELRGETGLGMGSLYTDTDLDIKDCDICMELSLSRGAALGSVGAIGNVSIRKTSAKFYLSGYELVGLGTVSGDSARVELSDANILLNFRGQRCSAIAALDGFTDLRTERIGLRVVGGGDRVLGFGGFSQGRKLHIFDTDTNVRLETSEDISKQISDYPATIISGRYKITVNGEEIMCSDNSR